MSEKEKAKEEKKERYRSFKAYSKISSIIYNLIGTILLGVVIGYILEKKTNNNNLMLISIIVFSVCGIISFYIRVVKYK